MPLISHSLTNGLLANLSYIIMASKWYKQVYDKLFPFKSLFSLFLSWTCRLIWFYILEFFNMGNKVKELNHLCPNWVLLAEAFKENFVFHHDWMKVFVKPCLLDLHKIFYQKSSNPVMRIIFMIFGSTILTPQLKDSSSNQVFNFS